MGQRIKHRRDTAANWTSANPTLQAGEFGYESDTNKLKIGDGATAWTSLAYFGASLVEGVNCVKAWTSSTSTTVLHGLGGIPKVIEVFAECLTAQNGYLVGDLVPYYQSNLAVIANATQLTVSHGSNSALSLPPKAGGVLVAMTAANWRAVGKAYR